MTMPPDEQAEARCPAAYFSADENRSVKKRPRHK